MSVADERLARRRMLGCSALRCSEVDALFEVRDETVRSTSGAGEETARVGVI
jgi:hypothetical protein